MLQDNHLFSGSIADNIRYGKPEATDAEVHGAARLANADHFIDDLPDGYETQVTGDGSDLSSANGKCWRLRGRPLLIRQS